MTGSLPGLTTGVCRLRSGSGSTTLCSQFEAAWAQGERPDPAAFSRRTDGHEARSTVSRAAGDRAGITTQRGEKPDSPGSTESDSPLMHDAIDETFASLPANGRRLPSVGQRGRRAAGFAASGEPSLAKRDTGCRRPN